MHSTICISVFDQNIVRTSPAGSCILRIVDALSDNLSFHLFFCQAEVRPAARRRETRIPLPPGPVVVRSFLFTLFALASHAWTNRHPSFSISTEGTYPFCDLCYAHFCHRAYLKEHRAAIGGAPLRRTARLLNHMWSSFTERLALRSARLVVVPSCGLARELERTYPQLVRGKIRVIPNPVDLAAFAKPSEATAKIESGLQLSFCALGNFERKGLRLIFEALAHLPQLEVRLTVVGGTPSEIRAYSALADSLGVAPRVVFVGLQNDIRPYLWNSDAFVFPSAYEVFPLVCLQAAAAGLPLLVTRLYGVEEFLLDGVAGWVVERDAESVARAIGRASENRNQLAEMGRVAQKQVAAYSEEEFVRRWRSLFESEISG
jgi:glycosyltransferase involved in cell wall biosynthesis